ncbi:E3 ubiquitin-protein ligase TRIM11-like [Sarcophilus harrisii]|uniref:E3 ubiquitin-protein ligase TRIM11-like n=1 Tax=Sarcophilus harrisii TaxID=9305 RepID=UPI001301D343|nr:E3 ubiquitin-protein ligase TRIM11-like [Sarcophilus harrisii]
MRQTETFSPLQAELKAGNCEAEAKIPEEAEQKMASCPNLTPLVQEALICPICREYFTNPASLECGHTFCQSCLLRSCKENSALLSCTECKRIIQVRAFQVNVSLGLKAAAAIKRRAYCLQDPVGPGKCEVHQEIRKRLCGEHRRPICVACSGCQGHETPILTGIDRIAEDFRKKLRESVKELCREREKVAQMLQNEKVLLEKLQEKAESQKKHIMHSFQKILEFLEEEKKECLSNVEKQIRAKVDVQERRITALVNQNQEFRKRITELEEECKKPDLDLLRNVREIVKRNEPVLHEEPQNFCLKMIICPIPAIIEAISRFKVDITLDPNTASPGLIISEDLKSVSYDATQGRELNPNGGFEGLLLVLATQSFISQRCYWEVQVPGNTSWSLGVCKLLPELKSFFTLMAIAKDNGNYLYASSKSHLQENINLRYLCTSESAFKVGIFLDYHRGDISFYHVNERCLIYTFPTISFSGPLKPLFSLTTKGLVTDCSLTICP